MEIGRDKKVKSEDMNIVKRPELNNRTEERNKMNIREGSRGAIDKDNRRQDRLESTK